MPATRVRGRSKPPQKALPGRLKPRKSPQQSRSKELVAAILDAAYRVLISRGFDGLTMQEVAKVAGMSPGSLYQYFPDKVSLVTQIIEAVLFVGGQPLTAKKIASLFDAHVDHFLIETLIETLNEEYRGQNRPYESRLGEGGYRLILRPEFEGIRNRVYGIGPREVRLSQDCGDPDIED